MSLHIELDHDFQITTVEVINTVIVTIAIIKTKHTKNIMAPPYSYVEYIASPAALSV